MTAEQFRDVQIPGTDDVYRLRVRLSWLEQQRIDEMAAQFVINGRALARLDDLTDLTDLDEVTVIPRTADQNFTRLCARLVGVKPAEIRYIPARHVAVLLAEISSLEREEAAEIARLEQEHPTTPRSGT